jgi:hypothetical protein
MQCVDLIDESHVCPAIVFFIGTAESHRQSQKLKSTPESHEGRKNLARRVEQNLIIAVGGVEACEKIRFTVDFRVGVPWCSGGMSGSQNKAIKESVIHADLKFPVGSPKNN